MSSHHVVRDAQEPALLIADAASLSFEHIESLLEWSPTVLVLGDALMDVLKWNIKIDVVIASVTSIEKLKSPLQSQSPVQLLGFESGDLLKNGLDFLVDKQYPAVNVVADIYRSQVLDIVPSYSSEIDTVIFSQDKKWLYCRNGWFEKWVDIGTVFGLHPLHSRTFLTTEGFYQERDNEFLLEPIELTSSQAGRIKIKTNQKPFWLVEDLLISANP